MKRATVEALQPWHLGEFEGKEPDDAVHQGIDYYIEHPDEVPPGKGADGKPAESFNAAKSRQLTFLRDVYADFEAKPESKIGVVMHSRGMELLQSWVDAGCPEDFKIDHDEMENPGDPEHTSMLRWDADGIEEVDAEDDDQLKPGVYLILHGLTDDDTDEGNADELDKTELTEELEKGGPGSGRYPAGSNGKGSSYKAPSGMVQKYLPPIEVHRAAKSAWDLGTSVLDITCPLAEGEGLTAETVAKIAEHFADSASLTEPATTRDAWGGSSAAKWAERVAKKAEKDLVEKGGPGSGRYPAGSGLAGKKATIDGVTYLMRTNASVPELRSLHASYEAKYGKIDFHRWLGERGKVHIRINKEDDVNVQKAGNGVMLAFWPDAETQKKIAVPGGEKPEDIHITLAYFGKLDEMSMDCLPAMEKAVEHFANTHAPVKVTLGGVGRFPASPQSDGMDVAYLGVHSDAIQKFRQELVDCVEAMGVEPRKNFGYNPHITLKMIPPHAPHLVPTPEPMMVTFDRVILSIGTARKEYVLAGPAEEITKHDDFEIYGDVVKLDKAQHLVFGWASIVKIGDKDVIDTQGDVITTDTLEQAAISFVLNARKAGHMHEDGDDGEAVQVGQLVESVVFTPEKQAAMLKSLKDQGIDATISTGCVCWWVGFKIAEESIWNKIVSGELKGFSVGGTGKRTKIEGSQNA